MDIKYCYEKCEKGRTKAKDLIWRCESMFDAAFDFEYFCKDCFINCPFKDSHQEATNDQF